MPGMRRIRIVLTRAESEYASENTCSSATTESASVEHLFVTENQTVRTEVTRIQHDIIAAIEHAAIRNSTAPLMLVWLNLNTSAFRSRGSATAKSLALEAKTNLSNCASEKRRATTRTNSLVPILTVSTPAGNAMETRTVL